MDTDVKPDHAARSRTAAAQGFLARQALFGDARVAVRGDALRP